MRAILPVVAGVAVIALAACGTAHDTTTSAVTSTGATAAPTPKQRAEADAASLLASFVPPPGATRLPKAPAVPGGYLKTPITTLGDGYQSGDFVRRALGFARHGTGRRVEHPHDREWQPD